MAFPADESTDAGGGGHNADMTNRAGETLAANLRSLRERRSLSLSELARRSGIAKGTLSALESGTGNPTIETVFSLSNALQVPVSTLLDEQATPGVLVVRAAQREPLCGDATELRLLRRLEFGSSMVEVYQQLVRPDRVQRSAGHPGVEHIVVTTGELRVGPTGDEQLIGPGDYVSFPAAEPHSYQAVGGPVTSVLMLEYPHGSTRLDAVVEDA